jgi:hypothetical protein
MPSLLEDHRPGPVVEMLYVEHCPNFPAALALVEQAAAELGINAEVWATMITDRPRPNTPGLWAPPQSVSTAAMSRRRVHPGLSPVSNQRGTLFLLA